MKTYLPTEYINENYRYSLNDYYITVRTNKNCYTQYSSTYCDCYSVYYNADYLSTEPYQCQYNTSTNISYSNFTDDFYYRMDIMNILVIFIILFVFIIMFPYKIFSRLFGRWLRI